MFKLVTILLCLGSALASEQDTYNMLVDETLFLARQLMVEYKLDTLPLPPIDVAFKSKKIGTWSSVTGTLKTGAATVVNATSIYRNGNASIQLIGEDKMTINVNIYTAPMVATFMEMDIHFESPFPFNNDGGMQLKIDENEVSLQITAQKSKDVCKLTVDDATLTKLGSIDFTILPDTWMSDIKDEGIDIYIGAHKSNVRAAVNMYMKSIMQNVIDKVNPCQYLP